MKTLTALALFGTGEVSDKIVVCVIVDKKPT